MARKILLADDSVTAQNMGRRILSEAGYDVLTVNNGSAALKKIAELKPDLVILDVYMPGYGGLEVCQRLKDSPETSHIPVLLTVGKLEPFRADEASRVHADAHLVKPFEASELLTALTKLEDKIVPQAESRARGNFAKTQAAMEGSTAPVDGAKFGDSTTGWKNRLTIPGSGHKPEEPVIAVETPRASATAFRDFERAPEVEETRAPASSVKDGMVEDVTADEIAAIAAAATAIEHGADSAQPAPPAFEEELDSFPRAAESWRNAGEFSSPIPIQQSEVQEVEASESQPSETQFGETQPGEFQRAEFQRVEVEQEPAVHEPVAFESAAYEPAAYEPAEVAQAVTEPVAVEPVTVPHFEKQQALEIAAVAESTPTIELAGQDSSPAFEQPSPVEVFSEPAVVESIVDAEATTALPAFEQAAPTEVSSEPAVVESVADAEVAAALESLAPVGGTNVGAAGHLEAFEQSAEVPVEKHEAVADHSEFPAYVGLAESSFAESSYSGPRWIAEELPLAQDEAASILEREMDKAYAELRETDAYRVSAEDAPAENSIFGEHRDQPAEAQVELAAMHAESFAADGALISDEPILNEVWTAVQAIPSAESEPAVATETIEHASPIESVPAPELQAAEPQVPEQEIAAALPAVEPEPVVAEATLVEAVASESMPANEITEPVAALFSETAVAEPRLAVTMPAEVKEQAAFAAAAGAGGGFGSSSAISASPEIPSPEAYSESIPAPPPEREAELAAAWAHWRQIRETIGPELTAHVTGAATAEFKDIQRPEPPAAPPGATAPTVAAAVADSASIASIVDNVLSQLRPRLVEEIARQLSAEKK